MDYNGYEKIRKYSQNAKQIIIFGGVVGNEQKFYIKFGCVQTRKSWHVLLYRHCLEFFIYKFVQCDKIYDLGHSMSNQQMVSTDPLRFF